MWSRAPPAGLLHAPDGGPVYHLIRRRPSGGYALGAVRRCVIRGLLKKIQVKYRRVPVLSRPAKFRAADMAVQKAACRQPFIPYVTRGGTVLPGFLLCTNPRSPGIDPRTELETKPSVIPDRFPGCFKAELFSDLESVKHKGGALLVVGFSGLVMS